MAHQPSIFFLPGLDRMVAGMLNEEEEKSNQSMIEVGTQCFFHSFFSLFFARWNCVNEGKTKQTNAGLK